MTHNLKSIHKKYSYPAISCKRGTSLPPDKADQQLIVNIKNDAKVLEMHKFHPTAEEFRVVFLRYTPLLGVYPIL